MKRSKRQQQRIADLQQQVAREVPGYHSGYYGNPDAIHLPLNNVLLTFTVNNIKIDSVSFGWDEVPHDSRVFTRLEAYFKAQDIKQQAWRIKQDLVEEQQRIKHRQEQQRMLRRIDAGEYM